MALGYCLGGDCRTALRRLLASSVHCVVTSPPYWGLRDYGTARWEGGDPACEHAAAVRRWDGPKQTQGAQSGHSSARDRLARRACRCGAARVDAQVGAEATPEEYITTMVEVFREVRRVLRDDGTLWLNLGDSYINGTSCGLPPKNLAGIPWRVALALQADGWYLRSDVVWAKPNPMPESVADRPTRSHEHVFLLAKSERYFYDADAVREPLGTYSRDALIKGAESARPDGDNFSKQRRRDDGLTTPRTRGDRAGLLNPGGRNARDVWTIAPAPYRGAHFAVMPPELVERCVLAGTSAAGCCAACGAPRRRLVEREMVAGRRSGAGNRATHEGHAGSGDELGATSVFRTGLEPRVRTVGWEPSCGCLAAAAPCVVLDPFMGSGTVAGVAEALGRAWRGVELNPAYRAMHRARAADVAGWFARRRERVAIDRGELLTRLAALPPGRLCDCGADPHDDDCAAVVLSAFARDPGAEGRP